MGRNGFLLPALGLGLLYRAGSLGLLVVNLRGSGGSDGGDPGMLLHFALTLAVALGLYWAVRAKAPSLPHLYAFAALLALTGLLCAAIPFLPGDLPWQLFHGKPPVISICSGLLMPAGLALFFCMVQANRAALICSLLMLLCEALWILLFPLFSGYSDASPQAHVFYVYALNCLAMGGAGICLGAALFRFRNRFAGGVASFTAVPHRLLQDAPVSGEKRAALLWLFGASVCLFVLTGLTMGMVLPKLAIPPGIIRLACIFPLLLLPAAGLMLDGARPHRLIVPLAAVCLCAPFFRMAHELGMLDRLALFFLILAIRQTILLTLFAAVGRLLKGNALLIPLLALGHALHLLQILGELPRSWLSSLPYGVFAASLLLAAATALCLMRFRGLLTENPELWALPPDEHHAHEQEARCASLPAAPDPGPLAAFSLAHGLSRQETLVLKMLAQQRSTEDIAKALHVTGNTVRTYVARILQKTGAPNRARLMALFSPSPREPEPAETGAPASRP